MLNLSVGGKGAGDGMKDLPGDVGASGFYQTVEFLFLFLFDLSPLDVFSLFLCVTARCELGLIFVLVMYSLGGARFFSVSLYHRSM